MILLTHLKQMMVSYFKNKSFISSRLSFLSTIEKICLILLWRSWLIQLVNLFRYIQQQNHEFCLVDFWMKLFESIKRGFLSLLSMHLMYNHVQFAKYIHSMSIKIKGLVFQINSYFITVEILEFKQIMGLSIFQIS